MTNEHPQRGPRSEQEVLLAVLLDEAPHEIRGRAYVQKLVFLVQEHADERPFVFEAQDYGPFSNHLYSTLDYMIQNDYVIEEEVEDEHERIRYHYTAGAWVEKVFERGDYSELREAVRTVFDEYPTDELRPLLDRVYSENPKMARNSIY